MVTGLTTAYPLLPSLLAVKHWSKILSHAARDTTPLAPLMGEDENSIIHVKTETKKDKGDSITFGTARCRQRRGDDPLLAVRRHLRDRHDLLAALTDLHRPPAHSVQPPRRSEGPARSVVW